MPSYVTLNEVKAFVGIPVADVDDDAVLTAAIDATEAQVDAWCGRSFGAPAAEPTIRYYTALNHSTVLVDPIQNTTGLVVESDETGDGVFETTWTIDVDFRLSPYNAAGVSQPYTQLSVIGENQWPTVDRGIKVTARFGYTAVPAPVAYAVRVQASRLFKRKDAPFGIAGTPEFGSELRLLAALDPDVQALLRSYKTWWVVAV